MRRITLLLTFCIAGTALVLVSCKPIVYYLQQVDKAYGRVTDAATGMPLESVDVSIHGYQYSELTNSLGDYELELADGTWTLDFVKDGYVTLSQVVTVSPTAKRAQVNAQLTPVAPVGPPPSALDFVGTWKTTTPVLFTVTLTETTFATVVGDPNGDSESLTGTIVPDTAAKHILATVVTESYTGNAPSTPMVPGANLYLLYSVSGTELTMAAGPTGYPANLESAYVFTKQ